MSAPSRAYCDCSHCGRYRPCLCRRSPRRTLARAASVPQPSRPGRDLRQYNCWPFTQLARTSHRHAPRDPLAKIATRITRRNRMIDVASQPRGKRRCKSSRVGIFGVAVADLDQVNGDVVTDELDIVQPLGCASSPSLMNLLDRASPASRPGVGRAAKPIGVAGKISSNGFTALFVELIGASFDLAPDAPAFVFL